ncbi:MAG: putative HIT-like protein [Candidatus Mesenet longicola]|uniref:HIT-like protein n=1 Tax=Candidatus Mesenet longicola TaxID=1892558 RepID=A0A8J3HP18_9RICK|nr:MAG: putative HIT-like protein [Candidatus Mesenet longicola]GHM59068.1 MAG: putative HIT-like protein [Candidatus Mesenet longicola]
MSSTVYDNNNVFAKILQGELACKKVYEDEQVLAFEDKYKKAPIHILAIPKGKYISFDDFISSASDNNILHFFKIIRKIAHDHKLDKTGYRLITNHGEGGGQEIPHFHVHILSDKDLKIE